MLAELRGSRALVWIASEARRKEIVQIGRQIWRQWWVLVLHDAVQCRDRLELIVRRLPIEQLKNGAAERPDVRGGRERGHLDHFGRHPVGSADHARRSSYWRVG